MTENKQLKKKKIWPLILVPGTFYFVYLSFPACVTYHDPSPYYFRSSPWFLVHRGTVAGGGGPVSLCHGPTGGQSTLSDGYSAHS